MNLWEKAKVIIAVLSSVGGTAIGVGTQLERRTVHAKIDTHVELSNGQHELMYQEIRVVRDAAKDTAKSARQIRNAVYRQAGIDDNE